MLISNGSSAVNSSRVASLDAAEETARKTVALLEELLAHSIGLRNLYQHARLQTPVELHQLRCLFDAHYKEQLRLVDVLIDRVRILGGSGGILARDFLQGTRRPCGPRGREARSRLLCELLDAHELILSAALDGGIGDGPGEGSSRRDFAVGQVVLANELQSRYIGELLLGRDHDLGKASPIVQMSD
jgi:starvation-inducible DNA-binding protein